MTEQELIYYCAYRVKKPGNLDWKAIEIPREILAERRAYIRQILKGTRFWNATNDDIDNMLLSAVPNGYLVEDTNGYEFFIPDSTAARQAGEDRLNRSWVPKEYTLKFMKSFNWSIYGEDINAQMSIVKKFIAEFKAFADKGMGLYIYSGVKGSGKTLLSCVILNEISSKYGVNTKFITATDYLNITKKSYDGDTEDINTVKTSALLVVDDIGAQLSREWTDTVFFELVNYRYNNKLPVIYTSNLPYDKLKMDERITDRVERSTILLKIPEKPVRRIEGSREKDRFMQEMGITEKSPRMAATTQGHVQPEPYQQLQLHGTTNPAERTSGK